MSALFKREKHIEANVKADVDVVEKENLLRRIRIEIRDLDRQQLAELSVQKSLLGNNFREDNDPEYDYEVEIRHRRGRSCRYSRMGRKKERKYKWNHNHLVRTKVDTKKKGECCKSSD